MPKEQITYRFAEREDVPLILKFIKELAKYEKMGHEVVAQESDLVRGITNIMLIRSLQELEAHGLVERIQYEENPPHVEYCLSEAEREN